MKRSIVRPGLALLLLSLHFHTAAPAFAQSKQPTVAEIALDQGENRLQRLIAGAKKEGELTLYGSMTEGDKQALLDAYTKKYGIKTKSWRSGSEAVVQKVVNEARAGRFEVDIVGGNGSAMEALHREQLLQRDNSPHHGDLMPQAIPAHNEWVGTGLPPCCKIWGTKRG